MKHFTFTLLAFLFFFLSISSYSQQESKIERIQSKIKVVLVSYVKILEVRSMKMESLRASIEFNDVNITDAKEVDGIIYVTGSFSYQGTLYQKSLNANYEEIWKQMESSIITKNYIAKVKEILGDIVIQEIKETNVKLDNGKPLENIFFYFDQGMGNRIYPAENK